MAKAACWTVTDVEARRRGDRTGLETRVVQLSLIHISEPTRQEAISYAVFCLKKKNRELEVAKVRSKTYRLIREISF